MGRITQPDAETIVRVVLVHPVHRALLALNRRTSVLLPRVTIAPKGRPAQQIAEQLSVLWGIQSVVLDILPSRDGLVGCAIAELLSTTWNFEESGFVLAQIDILRNRELSNNEGKVVSAIISANTSTYEPFARLGWVENVQQWIRESTPGREINFDIRAFKSSSSGHNALARFAVYSGPALWLKATGSINQHEFSIVQKITRYCPECVPPLIATNETWRAWLTEEAGTPLDRVFDWYAFEKAAASLAHLQKASIDHTDALLTCGCSDHRLPRLRVHLPSMSRYLEHAMTQQASTKVPRLQPDELRKLESLLDMACEVIDRMEIPATLGHNDLNLTNILFDGRNIFFIDWSEATLEHPFLSYHNLRVQAVERDQGASSASLFDLQYKHQWKPLIPEKQIEKALTLSQPLAIASYLFGQDPCFKAPYRETANVQCLARSLARQMERLVRSSSFRKALYEQ